MRISVVLPVHNGAAHIAEALASVLDAAVDGLEVIVVDDGSRDATPEILRTFADQRLRVLRNSSNLGIVASLNRGIAAAQGVYIARMDADDISLPGRVSAQAEHLDVHPEVGILGGLVLRIDASGRPLEAQPVILPTDPDRIRFLLWWHNVVNHPTVMARRALLEELGGYREAAYPSEDYDLWLRAAERTGIANLAVPLLRYRVHGASISGRRGHSPSGKAEEAAAAAQGRALGRAVAVETVRLIRQPRVLREGGYTREAVAESLDVLHALHERWLATEPRPAAREQVERDITGWIAALALSGLRSRPPLAGTVIAHRGGRSRRRVAAGVVRRAWGAALQRL